MKTYTIVTRDYDGNRLGGKSIFLTKATTIKSALNNLLKRSFDFKFISDRGKKKIQIIIKEDG